MTAPLDPAQRPAGADEAAAADAARKVRDLPAETALGNVDPDSGGPDAARWADQPDAAGSTPAAEDEDQAEEEGAP